MSRAVNIIISTVMWCGIAAYIVAANAYSRNRSSEIAVREMRIVVADSVKNGVVTTSKVARWLREGGINPVGQIIGENVNETAGSGSGPNLRQIESTLAARPEVKRVSAWTNLDGVLTVRVEGRTPMMRVRTAGGYRFWFTDDGYILPDNDDFSVYVPVVTGTIPFPFSPSAQGSYSEMERANYNDFLERFKAVDAERRSVMSQYNTTRARLRTTRASGPKPLWSKLRDSLFYVDRATRIAELGKEVARLEGSLADLSSNRRSLVEKEKKSYQSYRFLSKLANFVGFIERDDFWSAQIVQINVLEGGTSTDVGVSPELEIIPRAGNHTILLGGLDGTEAERLEKLRLFYLEGLWYEGWDKYRYIDIKYRNQIVCTE